MGMALSIFGTTTAICSGAMRYRSAAVFRKARLTLISLDSVTQPTDEAARAAILVSRGMKVLQAAPAACPYRRGTEGTRMLTVGSVTREDAAARFPFLAAKVSGRRSQIKEFTHRDPDFVFWIYPDGRLHDAKGSHRDNVPRGYNAILDDEP